MTATDGTIWAVILLAGVGTYALRASFLFLFERLGGVPDRVETMLRMVPAAVLAALVVPAILAPGGSLTVVGNDRVPAAIVAAIVAGYTRSIFATILVGLVALVAIGAL